MWHCVRASFFCSFVTTVLCTGIKDLTITRKKLKFDIFFELDIIRETSSVKLRSLSCEYVGTNHSTIINIISQILLIAIYYTGHIVSLRGELDLEAQKIAFF